MPTLTRSSLAGMIVTLLLAGCAHHPTTPAASKTGTSQATASTSAVASTTGATTTHHPQRNAGPHGHVTVEEVKLPDRTGIAACDDYLSSYMACHRAAGVFTPSQLPERYDAMRTSLLRDSENPDIRPQLAARCNSLATTLREALHGKSCAVSPAPASSTR
ncbi:hypothetical protein [Rhodanobacter sp. C01]|uniref:hypothetical protein n=1 Tax=Rhodanobacter sp. C01 TaxID=1945856 RepID=UPI000986BA3E|nr:hypothetical protein [Rhodanobacter sp. C01]OOG51526.1 hypothetical protein B0E50_00090 [Rhodanobacter sp. C01]